MKKDGLSKNGIIRYESELIHQFRQLIIEGDPDLDWQIPQEEASTIRPSSLDLSFDGRCHRFDLVYSLKPSIPELESLITSGEGKDPPLLVTPSLKPRILDFCRAKRLAALDLNGRSFLRKKGVLVDRRALPGRDFRFEVEPRNIFVGKSVRIVRSLLTDFDGTWVQSELVQRTKASSGLVSRIVRYLISQGFAEKTGGRQFRLIDPHGLLDAWVQSDDFSKRTTTTQYSILGNDHRKIAHSLKQWADDQEVPLAFTQWFAAWLRHPYTEPVVTSAYVVGLPDSATLDRLGFRTVSDGGKVWLHVPNDEGVFLETKNHQGLPLASDAQIYLDLQKTGLRGPDQAAALREWEGFCRP